MFDTFKYVCSVVVCITSISVVYAAGPGIYTGLDLGYSNLNNKARPLPAPGATLVVNPNGTTSPSPAGPIVSPDNNGMAGRFFLGGNINPYFGIEMGLSRYAPSTYKAPDGETGNIHLSALDFEGIGMLPLTAVKLTFFGKLGFAYLRAVQSRKLTARGDSSNNSGLHPLVGVGVGYDLTPRWVADLSAVRVISRSRQLPSPNLIALGMSYHWTDEYCGQFLC